MKLVWCPETAAKAYIDTVKSLTDGGDRDLLEESDVAELVSAMAGGWKAQIIVEACWSPDASDGVATSLGLATAARHTRGRHVCVVPDERVRSEFAVAMRATAGEETTTTTEVVVGEAEEVMAGISGVDFAVVDWRREDSARILRSARLGPRGAVLVFLNGGPRSASGGGGHSVGGTRWRGVLMAGTRVVRSAFLPIGSGVEIVHVGVGRGPSLGGGHSRWIKHVDRDTGEEHVFRRMLLEGLCERGF